MAHSHAVVDRDTHYIIDPITRVIKNENNTKNTLIQNDHNSERFTFECPRYIEDHDMADCNRVEVHFINIGQGREESKDAYVVTDLTKTGEGETHVKFSWLISSTATKYIGSLNFVIRFACIENDKVTYQWFTAINKSVSVGEGIYNTDDLAEEFSDILLKWLSEVESRAASAYDIAVKHGFKGTEEEWVASLKGKTPTKGVDYWNLEDQEEVKQFIRQELGVIENGSY